MYGRYLPKGQFVEYSLAVYAFACRYKYLTSWLGMGPGERRLQGSNRRLPLSSFRSPLPIRLQGMTCEGHPDFKKTPLPLRAVVQTLELGKSKCNARKHYDGATAKQEHVPHLNGLRALAFIGVLLFHFRVCCQGGFLGVDVFFVLSGYLMTRSIMILLNRGSFSYVSFLRRRFWRLYPALLVVNILSLVLAYCFFPSELALQTAYSSLASTLGVSNYFFMVQEGYFGTSSAFKPLLHTWSLSVEWQFYILWPLVLALGTRLRFVPGAHLLLVLLIGSSFAHGISTARFAPQAAFYMLPGRVFEFAVGALASSFNTAVISARLGNILTFLGTSLILLSFVFINSSHGPPALIALPSVLGATMVILSPSNVLGNRFYTSSSFDYLGKISYSAYLVHWPVYVFYHNVYEHTSAPLYVEAVVIVLLMVLSAWLFRSVEDEYRIPRSSRHKATGILLFVLVLVLTWTCISSSGWNWRHRARKGLSEATFSAVAMRREFENLYRPHEQPLDRKHGLATFGYLPGGSTKSVANGSIFDAIVVGDSFAAPLAGALDELAGKRNMTFLLMSHYSCAPLLDKRAIDVNLLDYPNAGNNPRAHACKKSVRPEMLRFIKAAKSSIVVLAGDWGAQPQMYDIPRPKNVASGRDMTPIGASQVEETIDILLAMGKKVVLIGVVPGSNYDVRACYASTGPLSYLKQCPERAHVSSGLLQKHSRVRDALSKLLVSSSSLAMASKQKRLAYVDPWREMCDFQKGLCVVATKREPLYYDRTHLTRNGSLLLQQKLETSLVALLRTTEGTSSLNGKK